MSNRRTDPPPPVPKFDGSAPSFANPDAPVGKAVPLFTRQLPKSEDISIKLGMMTPRTVTSGRSHIVMTPRAVHSPFDKPSVPVSRTQGSSSKLKVVSGPTKSSKEKTLFQQGYEDRAADRRKGSEGANEPLSFKIDKIEIEREIIGLEKSSKETLAVVSDILNGSHRNKFSPTAERILGAMNLYTSPSLQKSIIWKPGRATLQYDFKSYGHLPQFQIRSQAEVDALGLSNRTEKQLEKENELIKMLQKVVNRVETFQNTDKNVFQQSSTVDDDLDMFADDTSYIMKEAKHREKFKLSSLKSKSEEFLLPVSVGKLIDSLQTNSSKMEPATSLFGYTDLPSIARPAASSTAQSQDDYGECYPGVYEAAGVEYDSDEEPDAKGNPEKGVGKKRQAAQEQRQSKRKFDREVSAVEKIMKENFGD